MKKLWLLFAQFTTLLVAMLLVISVFKPEWLSFRTTPTPGPVMLNQPASIMVAPEPTSTTPVASYRAAAKKAMPAVVNIYTSKQVRTQRNPLESDPIFRRFFGDQLPQQTQRVASLG